MVRPILSFLKADYGGFGAYCLKTSLLPLFIGYISGIWSLSCFGSDYLPFFYGEGPSLLSS